MCNSSGHSAICHADVEYVGAGSNRSFSFTDLLLRSGNTDLSELSAANWGVIEVKGPWQLDLPDCITLSDAFSHPSHCKQVAPALQQVGASAYMLELAHKVEMLELAHKVEMLILVCAICFNCSVEASALFLLC